MATDKFASAPWQTRPVFISSTFKDMQAERTYLQHDVFLRLNEELYKARIRLELIDLRQGVETADLPSDEKREQLVLKVCLEEIKRCRPFLIVLLGDRYGWVPPEERMTAEAGFAADTIAKWMTPQEILDAAKDEISGTSRRLIDALKLSALDSGRSFPPVAKSPPRTSTACVAIVRRQGPQGTEWLAQFNQRWGRYFLVGGHEEAGETKTECMLRELHEELHVEPTEVQLSTTQALSDTAWSIGYWQPTQYDITAIDVSFPEAVLMQISHRAENRWLTAAEIRGERTRDNKLINPTMRFVLNSLGALH